MNTLQTMKNKAKEVLNKPQGKTLVVVSTNQISNNLKRIVFEDLSNTLRSEHESGYLKLQFTQAEQTVLRSYTILETYQEADKNYVVIDFVIHEGGFGAQWAKHAAVGDVLNVKGPGDAKLVNTELDWFFLIGDLTSLPAITVNLKVLPKDAKGYAVIEVLDKSDILELEKPDGIEIEWVINSNPSESAQLMLSKIQAKDWLEGTSYIWLASEFESARTLRQYFRKEKQANKTHFYVSSYWKLGETDEGNKRAKKADGQF